jgi:hypothetical protein
MMNPSVRDAFAPSGISESITTSERLSFRRVGTRIPATTDATALLPCVQRCVSRMSIHERSGGATRTVCSLESPFISIPKLAFERRGCNIV